MPCPSVIVHPVTTDAAGGVRGNQDSGNLIRFSEHCSFQRIVRITQYIRKLIFAAKRKIHRKNNFFAIPNLFRTTYELILRSKQAEYLPEVRKYFAILSASSHAPNMVNKLNIYRGNDGLLRVRHKFRDVKLVRVAYNQSCAC